jgi:hypothetical protein
MVHAAHLSDPIEASCAVGQNAPSNADITQPRLRETPIYSTFAVLKGNSHTAMAAMSEPDPMAMATNSRL